MMRDIYICDSIPMIPGLKARIETCRAIHGRVLSSHGEHHDPKIRNQQYYQAAESKNPCGLTESSPPLVCACILVLAHAPNTSKFITNSTNESDKNLK